MKHGALASKKFSKCIGLQSCIETLHIAIHIGSELLRKLWRELLVSYSMTSEMRR